MQYSPSKNIERDTYLSFNYIPTTNAKLVASNILDGIKTGFHSFNIIGTYGTGKSSFLLAFEENLSSNTNILFNKEQIFGDYTFRFFNIVGEYTSFQQLLRNKLGFEHLNFFKSFDEYISNLKNNEYLIVAIDEFGKILEHAGKNNPEEELFFIQQFSEYITDQKKRIILLTTLHQNFSSYSYHLNKNQRNEWEKVKGRFKEVVFNEPPEQLLFLAANYLKENRQAKQVKNTDNYKTLYELAYRTKFLNSNISLPQELVNNIYPLDLFSAYILTLAIQKYGQNERSLFSFLESKDQNRLTTFIPKENETYNIFEIGNYIEYNFYSYIQFGSQDKTGWTALKIANERVEALFEGIEVIYACKIVKTIGLLNIFAKSGAALDKNFLEIYSKIALGIPEPSLIIDKLVQFKIIRYAIYKSQYVLFEGTDLDIEVELLNAGLVLRKGTDFITKLKNYFDLNYIHVKAISYKKGTPRFFEFVVSEEVLTKTPLDEVDGYINLLFSENVTQEEIINHSKDEENAIIYAYYKDYDRILDIIFQIDKYQFVLEYKVEKEDRVAKTELEKDKLHWIDELKNVVINSLFNSSQVIWFFKGKQVEISNSTSFNKVLSQICDKIYSSTPVFKNELLNKFKLTSTMSTARNNFLFALLENSGLKDLGIEKYPPEKAIYKTMLENTGIHKKDEYNNYIFSSPDEVSFVPLWKACEEFFESTKNKARKIIELYNILNQKPFKLKPGFLEVWVVSYLIIKKEDYALYSEGKYVPYINKEVLDLMIRKTSDFSIKAFDVSGVRLNLFNKYREVLNLTQKESIEETTFIETIRPFLTFYRQLPNYAKNTKKLSKNTLDLRNTLAKAKDPEDTFFIDLPNALGFSDTDLTDNQKLLIDFVNILQESIRELRTCFNDLLNRIEEFILDVLGIEENDYEIYKSIIERKYENIKEYLLSNKQKAFHSRIMANLKDRKAWINSLTFNFLNKPIEDILDEEEEWLLDKLKYSFIELMDYLELQKMNFEPQDEVFKFNLTSLQKGTLNKQIVIPKSKIDKAQKLEEEISKMLSSDDQINIYALLKLLENKI